MSESQDRESRIRERAYALWEKEGSPEGREEEFWMRAESLEDEYEILPDAPPEPAEENQGIDVDLDHSFPASDPPSFTPAKAGGAE
jgi:hypothetical protein